jgi:hypothetical protein
MPRLLFSACLLAVLTLPAFALTPVIDNDRVTVWDVRLRMDESAPPTPADFDSVTVFLEGGEIRTRHTDGTVSSATRKFGDAVFTPKGAAAIDTPVRGPAHEVVIWLKGPPTGSQEGPPGIPNAFPRPGSETVFENDRVRVSRFSWTKAKPVAMHHHDKDTVMVFRYDGAIRSTAPDGTGEILDFRKDQIQFSKAGRVHSELLVGPRQSAVMTELK